MDPGGSIIGVRDADEAGRVLGITEFDDTRPGTCSVVLDPAVSGSTPLLGTCDYALDEFSPDGSYVLASDTYGDGIGSGTIAVFETDGDRLSYRNNRSARTCRFYNSAVWEDETHVLFTLFQDGTVVDGADGRRRRHGARPPASGREGRGSPLALRDALTGQALLTLVRGCNP